MATMLRIDYLCSK